jgi:hypothetical protein
MALPSPQPARCAELCRAPDLTCSKLMGHTKKSAEHFLPKLASTNKRSSTSTIPFGGELPLPVMYVSWDATALLAKRSQDRQEVLDVNLVVVLGSVTRALLAQCAFDCGRRLLCERALHRSEVWQETAGAEIERRTIDPLFPNSELEYYTKQKGVHKLYRRLLIRRLSK